MKNIILHITRLIAVFVFLFLVNHITFGSSVSVLKADSLRREALHDIDEGRAADAQNKLIEAYEIYEKAGDWDKMSLCLYERAIDYMNIQDLMNMGEQAELLCELSVDHPSVMTRYNYHSVTSGYYSLIDSIDLAIQHGWGAVHALEQIENPYDYNIVPVWSYYNLAFFYDMYFNPPQVDSVRYYLAKSREVLKDSRTRKDSIEGLISVVDLEAWQEYYEKDYTNAERMMLEVIDMIDTVAKVSPNTVITERGEAYKFLAMIYEEQGRWQDALRYYKLIIENNNIRYDLDKRLALQKVQTQYEVDKHKIEIHNQQLTIERNKLELEQLNQKNRANQWLLIALSSWLIIVCAVVLVLYLRKKNIESRLYEAALEADNMRHTITDLKQKTNVKPIQLMVDELISQLQTFAKRDYVQRAIVELQNLDLAHIQVLLEHGKKITTMDKRYILCFAANMSVEDIAEFMSLEPASVYTVRYRIRKKFSSQYPFPY